MMIARRCPTYRGKSMRGESIYDLLDKLAIDITAMADPVNGDFPPLVVN
jgi:hypothetical protein